MQFVKPQLFTEAVEKIGARSPIGAKLSSAEWRDVPVALRERALFSSQVENVRFLQRARDGINDFLTASRDESGALTMDRQRFVTLMSEFAQREGMGLLDGDSRSSSLQDITSQKRLELIFDTNVRAAQDFGNWKQGMDPDVLNEFPAQRFLRVIEVDEPRDWHSQFEDGVWLKSDVAAWSRINQDFGVPWGPWGWGCGHDVEDVDRDEAEALGLIQPGQRAEPALTNFNERLQASVKHLDPDLRAKLKEQFGEQIEIEGESARWRSSSSPTPAPAPVPVPEPTPAPVTEPKSTPRPTLDEVMENAGVLGKDQVTKSDMIRLRRELQEAAPVKESEVIARIKGADKSGALTDAGVRGVVQEFLDFLPPELVRQLPKLTVDIKGINAHGQYGLGGSLELSPFLTTDEARARQTIFHELMHWVHREGPKEYREAITAHFRARTAGEKIVHLPNYPAAIRGKTDKWYEPYAGRVYGFERPGEDGLEVPTRYIEWLAMPPAVQAELWNNPHFRETMMVVLKGIL
jgi:hypothetical protein